MKSRISNNPILFNMRKILIAALIFCGAPQLMASPSGPLSCAGEFGVGGCAPYAQVNFSTGGNDGSLFEYDDVILDYSAAGPTATTRGVVDLANGRLKVFASGIEDGDPDTFIGGTMSASGTDVFTLHGTSVSGFITFSVVLTANGIGSIAHPGYSGGATVQLGVPGGGGGAADIGIFQAEHDAPRGPFSILSTQHPGQQLRASDTHSVLLNTPFSLAYSLRADVLQGTTFDLSNTAHLSFVLPAGVTITSMGGFSSVSAVPEPETYAMLLAGLGLLGFVARRRKQKAA